MTLVEGIENSSIELERAEVLGARLSERLRIATRAIQQGTRAVLGSYEGKVILSSAVLAPVQVGIGLLVARGMSGGSMSTITGVSMGTAFMVGAQLFRDANAKDLQDEAAKAEEQHG